jgi:hypothetical protein
MSAPSSVSTSVSKIEGVLDCVVGDVDGTVLGQSADDPQRQTWIGIVSFAGEALGKLGSLLGLGAPQGLSAKCSESHWVAAFRSGRVLVARCSAARAAADVEALLTVTDWSALVTSSEGDSTRVSATIPKQRQSEKAGEESRSAPLRRALATGGSREAVPSRVSVPRPAGTPPRVNTIDESRRAQGVSARERVMPSVEGQAVRQASDGGSCADKSGKVAEASAANVQPRISGTRPAAARVAPTPPGDQGDADSFRQDLIAELRRALVKGQLPQAETISAKLAEEAKVRGTVSEATLVLSEMLEGIASVLAGDAFGGLDNLKMVESSASKSQSLRWVAQIWCVRASVGAGESLDLAYAYAKSALALAGSLDAEARAVSTIELAGIEFQQGDFVQALMHTRAARTKLASLADPQLQAGSWLLEARILDATGKHQESLAAAELARRQRPSWPAPAAFLVRQALRDDRLTDASLALKPLFEREPPANEVERLQRILEHVHRGAATAHAAATFLELDEGPSTAETVRQLEALSDAHPNIEQFRDAFGWRLLRMGLYDAAKVVFEALALREDLTEDVRSSVLLALGCLAAGASRHAKPSAKLRAVVSATPKNFSSIPPALPAPDKSAAEFPSDEPGTSPRAGQGQLMFSGSLSLFGIPDLLEFLRSGKRSGTLLCSSSAGIGAIHLRKGFVTGAASPNARGAHYHLMATGIITKEECERVTQLERLEKSHIGALLVESGLATAAQAREAQRCQIQDAIKDLMSWGVGKFAFDPDTSIESAASDIDVEVDPQQALLDIFKEIDEGIEAES